MDSLQLEGYLVDHGMVTLDQLQIARRECMKSGADLSATLLTQGLLSPAMLSKIEGQLYGFKTLDLSAVEPQPDALSLVASEEARALVVLPISLEVSVCSISPITRTLVVAMEKAHDVTVLDRLSDTLIEPYQLDIRLASRADILSAIDRFYGVELCIESLLSELDIERSADRNALESLSAINQMTNLLGADLSEHQPPAVRLVDAILQDAVRRHASDIHFEPERTTLRIRYRLDGVLSQIRSIHMDYWLSMLVRLKVLSGLDISETRMAQDGRMSLSVCGREMDVRVSCFPSVYGECLVLRLLDCFATLRPLTKLGVTSEQSERLTRLAHKPQGLILVTGPTGSGKSTTLYSMVNELRGESINIVTMEDPVEYRLPLVRQCSVNPSLKLDFANGIRSILRQDPDVILVGETRDLPTAEMVLKSVLSGHLVMTTLHAHSALGAITRLRELGIDTAQLSGLILGLIAQRLLRSLCTLCKAPDPTGSGWYVPVGCTDCDGIGFRGRLPIVEIVCPDEQINQLIALKPDQLGLSTLNLFSENTGLLSSAYQLLEDGLTSADEVCRVLGCCDLDSKPERATQTR